MNTEQKVFSSVLRQIEQPRRRASYCEDCGDALHREKSFPGASDEPKSTGGWWCDICQEWK